MFDYIFRYFEQLIVLWEHFNINYFAVLFLFRGINFDFKFNSFWNFGFI